MRADQVKRAAFGSKDDRLLSDTGSVGQSAHGQGAESVRITCREDAIAGHQYEREGAFNAAQGIGNGIRKRLLLRLRD